MGFLLMPLPLSPILILFNLWTMHLSAIFVFWAFICKQFTFIYSTLYPLLLSVDVLNAQNEFVSLYSLLSLQTRLFHGLMIDLSFSRV